MHAHDMLQLTSAGTVTNMLSACMISYVTVAYVSKSDQGYVMDPEAARDPDMRSLESKASLQYISN